MKSRNPTLTFDLIVDPQGFFESVVIVMPGAVAAWPTCHKVFSIDSAHGKAITIDRSADTFLKKFIFTVASGYTVNNTMIVYALSICYHESIPELRKFIEVMKGAGLDLDQPGVIAMSDRGAAVVSIIIECFKLAFHRPCPKHITRNLEQRH